MAVHGESRELADVRAWGPEDWQPRQRKEMAEELRRDKARGSHFRPTVLGGGWSVDGP